MLRSLENRVKATPRRSRRWNRGDPVVQCVFHPQVGFEGFVSHSSSYLIAKKASCIIIPDACILLVVASCNQTGGRQIDRLIRLHDPKCKTRAKLKLKGEIHTNENHKQSCGS